MSLERQAEAAIQQFLVIKQSTKAIADQVFIDPGLTQEVKALLKAEADLRMLMDALPKNHPVNISVESEARDFLQESDSVLAQFRRQQAKELARRIYPKVHPDRAETPSAYQLHQIRAYVVAGEIELLQLIARNLGIESAELSAKVVEGLRVRNMMMSSTPAFKLSRLFYSNKPSFYVEAKKILDKKRQAIDIRRSELLAVRINGMSIVEKLNEARSKENRVQ